jgi:hypothetical protein
LRQEQAGAQKKARKRKDVLTQNLWVMDRNLLVCGKRNGNHRKKEKRTVFRSDFVAKKVV